MASYFCLISNRMSISHRLAVTDTSSIFPRSLINGPQLRPRIFAITPAQCCSKSTQYLPSASGGKGSHHHRTCTFGGILLTDNDTGTWYTHKSIAIKPWWGSSIRNTWHVFIVIVLQMLFYVMPKHMHQPNPICICLCHLHVIRRN